MTSTTPRLISDMRGVRYGEVLAVYLRDDGLEAEVFGTQMLNDCPQELWETLDPTTIAKEMGAVMVKLNGPRHWTLDGLGQKVAVVEPVLRDFNGLTMRRIATVALGDNPAVQPTSSATSTEAPCFFFDAGKPVYELVNPDGLVYVMQAYCIGVDPTIDEGEPRRARRATRAARRLVLPSTDPRRGAGRRHDGHGRDGAAGRAREHVHLADVVRGEVRWPGAGVSRAASRSP